MGRNWAIAIGINGYCHMQKLNYAKQDAEAVRDYFHQDLQFEQIYHFTDDSPPIQQDYGDDLDSRPTVVTLRMFLRKRFEIPFLRAGDNLWFFFAGHGVRYEDRDYLMPIDGDPGDIGNSAISLHYITERLRRCGADNVVLLIDACRGASGRRDGLGIGEEKQQGVITLFSCSPRESSYEIDELQQGAFTYALLESLRLQGEQGNCATVERLYQRLRYTVPQLSQLYQKPRQTPYGLIEPPTKYHLILLPRKATANDILTLKNDAYRAESRQELAQAKQLWIRVLAVSVDPEAIEGIERLARVSVTPIAPSPPTAPPPDSGGRRVTTTTPTPPVAPPPPPTIPTFEFEVVTVDAQGKENSRKRGKAEYFTEDLGGGVRLDLVAIPGGSFQMGSADGDGDGDERPQHSVTIKPFLIGKYPVTQAQWKRAAALPKVKTDLNSDPAGFKGENRPIEQVSWNDAIEFCARLSKATGHEYRLPTEAEWEYAGRAGTSTPFHFGETLTTDLANYDGNYTYASAPKGSYRKQTTDVGSFPPNAFGLYDLHGNVWEWCLDHWHSNYKGAPIDGSAWITGGEPKYRLLRGGSWFHDPRDCRSADRNGNEPDGRDHGIGFRVVCSSAWTL
jgi:formylglycine-generating enzyme required for sulfatase activity/uncharacterized caspase-like protein